jgi:hypothetical protein
VALAADAAWTARREREVAREELETVLVELQGRHRELSRNGAWHARALAGTLFLRDRLAEVAEGAPLEVSDTIASQLVWVIVSDEASPMLNAFLSAGYVEQVENDSLRQLLLGWPPIVQDMSDDEERTADQLDQQIIPYLSQEFDFARPLELVFVMYVGDPDPTRLGVTRLRATPRLRSVVARQITMLQLITAQSNAGIRHLSELIDSIERELGSDGRLPS